MKVLECSSRGDKRFSAFYAKIRFYGSYDSIENHYQGVKRDSDGKIAGKGKAVDHININGRTLDVKYLTPLYTMMWIKYLDEHPELVEYAKQFDDFNDMFRGKCINCQADVIRKYVKDGRKSLIADPLVQELNRMMKSWK
jgi:hypothetical protein